MGETTVSDAVLARLEALEAKVAELEAEHARLAAALAAPAVVSDPMAPPVSKPPTSAGSGSAGLPSSLHGGA